MAHGSSGTAEFIKDVLHPLGSITVRRMFGGAGIYCDGMIFALVIEDVVYLKADAASIPAFEAESMGPFTYDTKLGQRGVMSYWRLPDRLFDEPDELVEWAKRAVAASHAAKSKAKPKSKPKPKRKS
jgi:DNA transformation protein and related proteins